MPWQQHVADVALEINPKTGRLVYRRVVLTVPRQSGKTTLQLALFLHRMLAFDTQQVAMYAAQNGLDARNKLKREWNPMLERSLFADAYATSWVTGAEALLFNNGSRLQVSAGTEKSGHGQTLDLAVIDEAFAQPDGRLEQAFSPAMITRPEPQLWLVSTAGKPTDLWFREKVEQGRELADDPTSGVAFFEWSAADDADPGDRSVWRSCMPALGFGHTSEAAIAAEFLAMPTDEFRRAYLNQWVGERHDTPFAAAWKALATDAPDDDPAAFAVDMTWDREWADIAWAAGGYVDLHRHAKGAAWVVPEAVKLQERYPNAPMWIHPKGPAAVLIEPLRAAGVRVEEITADDYARACGGFYDATVESRLRHSGHPALNSAVEGSAVRGGQTWTWDRKRGSVISPLVAATLAWHAANTGREPRIRSLD